MARLTLHSAAKAKVEKVAKDWQLAVSGTLQSQAFGIGRAVSMIMQWACLSVIDSVK